MTKEDMMIYADFMASCDVAGTPMSGGLGVGDLIPEESYEVWIEGLKMNHNGKEVCILPDKSGGELKIKSFTMDSNGDLFDYDWVPTDRELIDELKRQDFDSGFMDLGEMKYIILQKWPNAFKD